MIRIRRFRESDTPAVARLIIAACTRWDGRDGGKQAIRDYVDHFRLRTYPTTSSNADISTEARRRPLSEEVQGWTRNGSLTDGVFQTSCGRVSSH